MLLRLFLLLSLAAPAPAFAGFWDCVCNLVRPKCADPVAKELGWAIPKEGVSVVPAVDIGARVKVTLGKGKTVEGVVTDASYEELELGVVEDGKPTTLRLKNKKIEDLETLGTDDASTFEPDATRLRVKRERLAARKAFIDFMKTDHWAPVRESLKAEIEKLRGMKDKAERQQYLRDVGNDVVAKIKEKSGASVLGFHYNLNGGVGYQYVERGGLKISRGDVALVYTGATSSNDAILNEKIFFFRSDKQSLFEVLDAANPKLVFGGRMGSWLNVFRLDGPYIDRARAEGGIIAESSISFDFEPKWLGKQDFNKVGAGLVGIPYSSFLAPPVLVFVSIARHLDVGRLSRDEETLATMRFLENVLTH